MSIGGYLQGAKVNGKVGLQLTASQNITTAAQSQAPMEGSAQLQYETPKPNVYSIFKDIVIENNNEDRDLEKKKQMYLNVDLDNNTTDTHKRTYSNMKTDGDLAKNESNIHIDIESKYAIDINITVTDRKVIVDDEQKLKLLDKIHDQISKILQDSTFQTIN